MMRPLLLPFCILVFTAACTPQEDRRTETQAWPEIRLIADTVVWDEKLPLDLHYFDGRLDTVLSGKASYRGGSSRKYEKNQYALKLEDKFALAGLPEAKAFVLNGSYIDKTLMRHRLNFDLYRQMHPDNVAPRCTYADVWENDDYKGIFVITERINAGMLGLKKNKKDGAALWKEPMLLYEQEVYEQHPDLHYSQKYPDTEDFDHSEDLDDHREFLFHSDDETFAREVFRRFDRRTLIDWQLLLLFSNNSDGQRKNFYLFRTAADTPLRVALWDYDHSFGRDGDGEYNMMDVPIEENRIVLFRRLNELNPGGFREEMSERYAELRKSGIFTSDNIRTLVEQYESELRPHMARNVERWPHNADWYQDDNDFDREIEIIHQYVDIRLPALDKRFGYTL